MGYERVRDRRLALHQWRHGCPITRVEQRRRGGGVDHPWPRPLPASWSGRFDRPQPLPYTQVVPSIVAEIEVNTAYEHHRWRHPVRYVRPRLDLSVYDVLLLMP